MANELNDCQNRCVLDMEHLPRDKRAYCIASRRQFNVKAVGFREKIVAYRFFNAQSPAFFCRMRLVKDNVMMS